MNPKSMLGPAVVIGSHKPRLCDRHEKLLNRRAITYVACILLATSSPTAPFLLGQEPPVESTKILEMIEIVVTASETLDSQLSFVTVSSNLPIPSSPSGLRGASIGVSSSFWDQDQDEFQVSPTASIGLTFSMRDPAWSLNRASLAEVQARARQQAASVRAGLVEDLFEALDEIARLDGERLRQEALQRQLTDRLTRIRTQRVVVALEDVWNLEERIIAAESDLFTIERETELFLSRTAMQLGGERWQDLLLLLREWMSVALLEEVVGG